MLGTGTGFLKALVFSSLEGWLSITDVKTNHKTVNDKVKVVQRSSGKLELETGGMFCEQYHSKLSDQSIRTLSKEETNTVKLTISH